MSDQPPPPPPPRGRGDGAASSGSGRERAGLTTEAKNWAVIAHLSAFAGAFVAIALLGPLLVYLLKRDEHPFIEHHAREALNFNITFFILFIVGFLSLFLLVGIVLLPLVGLTWLILVIVAAVKASNGEHYTYPLTIRFIS